MEMDDGKKHATIYNGSDNRTKTFKNRRTKTTTKIMLKYKKIWNNREFLTGIGNKSEKKNTKFIRFWFEKAIGDSSCDMRLNVWRALTHSCRVFFFSHYIPAVIFCGLKIELFHLYKIAFEFRKIKKIVHAFISMALKYRKWAQIGRQCDGKKRRNKPIEPITWIERRWREPKVTFKWCIILKLSAIIHQAMMMTATWYDASYFFYFVNFYSVLIINTRIISSAQQNQQRKQIGEKNLRNKIT